MEDSRDGGTLFVGTEVDALEASARRLQERAQVSGSILNHGSSRSASRPRMSRMPVDVGAHITHVLRLVAPELRHRYQLL